MLLTIAKPQQSQAIGDYFDREFDAVLGLPPKQITGEYWAGYLRKVAETSVTPF